MGNHKALMPFQSNEQTAILQIMDFGGGGIPVKINTSRTSKVLRYELFHIVLLPLPFIAVSCNHCTPLPQPVTESRDIAQGNMYHGSAVGIRTESMPCTMPLVAVLSHEPITASLTRGRPLRSRERKRVPPLREIICWWRHHGFIKMPAQHRLSVDRAKTNQNGGQRRISVIKQDKVN